MPDDESRIFRTHEQARLNYDRASRWYDRLEGNWEEKPRQAALEMLAVSPGEQVLEVGCGTGSAFQALTRSGRVTGLDISAGMLTQAQKRLAKSNSQVVGLVHGDSLHLPFCAASFDVVFMAFTLELFDAPEIPLVLVETRRVLRQRGRVGLVALSRADASPGLSPGISPLAQKLYEWFHRQYPALVDCRPINARLAVETAGLAVTHWKLVSLWGLGVELVVAANAV